MKDRLIAEFGLARTAAALIALLALPVAAWAQVPVDENGEIIGNVDTLSAEAATGGEDIPLLSSVDLEELVGPIALYPDDLLAIVLPAAAYPLQIVDAARFLEALEDDPSLEPDPDWDDSVVALTNYPEVIELLNDDIDWTWRLGEAVVSQQADVVAAIETFRDRAYAAGNLKSDSYQNVSRMTMVSSRLRRFPRTLFTCLTTNRSGSSFTSPALPITTTRARTRSITTRTRQRSRLIAGISGV